MSTTREEAITRAYNVVTGNDDEPWSPDATMKALQDLYDAALNVPTDDEVCVMSTTREEARELIAEARRWPRADGVVPSAAPVDLISRLADAIEALLTPLTVTDDYEAGYAEGFHHGVSGPRTGDDEWEYGYNTGSTVSAIGDRTQVEYFLSQFDPPQRPGEGDYGSRTMRRRKAGPWEPVAPQGENR